MVERAFGEEAAAAGDAFVEDAVHAAEGAAPFGFIGAEEDDGFRADEGGEVGDAAVARHEAVTGGEVV